MDDIFDRLQDEILKALNAKSDKPLTPENLKISEDFHDKYYDKMFDCRVKAVLKNSTEIIGLYNDEFYEDASVFIDYNVVEISEIDYMELAEE